MFVGEDVNDNAIVDTDKVSNYLYWILYLNQ